MHLRLEKAGRTFLLTGQPLAQGGEAAIYEVPERPTLVAKVYHQPTAEHADKLAAMIAAPPTDPMAGTGHVSIAWPVDRLLEAVGARFVGYVMPRVDRVRPLVDFYNPRSRLQMCPLFHYGYLLRTARNVAAAVGAVHERGYVIGDLNESNLLVNNMALVTLVDTDSFQVPDATQVHRCPVGKPEYTPPELQQARFADFDRGPEHDAFALAVLIFQLLMQGIHPFAGRFTGEGEPGEMGERIAAGHWPYVQRRRVPYAPNPHAPPFVVLPPQIQALMRRCFEEGHARSSLRPDASAWHKALQECETELAACPANPKQHIFHRSLKSCPWCELARRQGRDLFPSAEDVQAGRVGTRRVTVRAPEVIQVALAPAPMSSRDLGRDGEPALVSAGSGSGPIILPSPSGPRARPGSSPAAAPVMPPRPSGPRAVPGSGRGSDPVARPRPSSPRPSDLAPPLAIPVGGSRVLAPVVLEPHPAEDEPRSALAVTVHRRRLWPWLAGAGGLVLVALILLVVAVSGGKKDSSADRKKEPSADRTLARKNPPPKEAKEFHLVRKRVPAASKLFPNGPCRFLSELPEFDVRDGKWPFRKGDCGDGRPIRVHGVLSPHGLGMHPPVHPGFAAVKYRLNKEAELFKATVAINDTTNWCWSPATFTVLGDGKELWQSRLIAHNHARSQECQVIIKGVDVLELRVQVPNLNEGVHAVWVEPRVLQKFDSPDQKPDEKPNPNQAKAPDSKKIKAAKEIATRLVDFPTRGEAVARLLAMGSEVETVLHPYLEHPDIWVKYAALDLLGKIGTDKSVKAMEKVTHDPNGAVAWTAKVRIQDIRRRMGQ